FLHDLIAQFGIASVADGDLDPGLIGKAGRPCFGEASVLCVVNHDSFGLRERPFGAAADEACKSRNGQQRNDGTTAKGFHFSSRPHFAAKTSRTTKHEINLGVMSIVEREQWNSSKERRAADRSETHETLRRSDACCSLFAARALALRGLLIATHSSERHAGEMHA